MRPEARLAVGGKGRQGRLRRNRDTRNINGWVALINNRGPVIAEIPGHYILIVGADSNANKLYVKDPLKFWKGDFKYNELIQKINAIFVVRTQKRTGPDGRHLRIRHREGREATSERRFKEGDQTAWLLRESRDPPYNEGRERI